MENTAPTFNWAYLAVPVLLTLLPAALFHLGYHAAGGKRLSFFGRPCYWLGAHGVTLVLASLLYIIRGVCVPDMVATQLPLLFVLGYLVLAVGLRSSFFFSVAVATPGLWMLATQCWLAFSGGKGIYFSLPLEPFWYLLAAVVLFAARYRPQILRLWGELDGALLTLSGSYLVGGLWLLALGHPSLLATLSLAPHLWAVALFAASAVLLWCATLMKGSLLAVSSAVGLAAGVYAFVTRYPW